jgi:putative phosphoribosyl transferase
MHNLMGKARRRALCLKGLSFRHFWLRFELRSLLMKTTFPPTQQEDLSIDIEGARLRGDLQVPNEALGLVIFAHGSGSGRKSSRNRYVARVLNDRGLGTLLFDLLTMKEEREDEFTAHLRFDIPMLSERLRAVTEWVLAEHHEAAIGYFGASTGAAAALIAASELGSAIHAVVSRGGRPDLAGLALRHVAAPTLLIIGGEDHQVIELNKSAFRDLQCQKELKIVARATHLFEEPGTLEAVADLAAQWFEEHLANPGAIR